MGIAPAHAPNAAPHAPPNHTKSAGERPVAQHQHAVPLPAEEGGGGGTQHYSFVTSFNHSIIQPFHHSIIPSFNHSIIQPFDHSIIRSLARSLDSARLASTVRRGRCCFTLLDQSDRPSEGGSRVVYTWRERILYIDPMVRPPPPPSSTRGAPVRRRAGHRAVGRAAYSHHT